MPPRQPDLGMMQVTSEVASHEVRQRGGLGDVTHSAEPDSSPAQQELHQAPEIKIAVLLPCRNEEAAIGTVVEGFRSVLPEATIYVYDNDSSDTTADSARTAGAIVRHVPTLGKGNVVRQMFADVEADVYVLADGDDTYDTNAAPRLIDRLLRSHLDMVIGIRDDSSLTDNAYRRGHRLGNRVLTRSVRWLFRGGSADMLSGYRALSYRFVKSFPALSQGFEIETEMTVHALELKLPFADVTTDYTSRPDGSSSKLRSIPDGIRILKFILFLWKDYRPLGCFTFGAVIAEIGAFIAAWQAHGYLHAWTPSTFAFVGLTALASLAVLVGILLDSLSRTQREVKRMIYLGLRQPSSTANYDPPPMVG